MTASPDTPDKEHKKWVIPVDYNLYCKIGETIYFFNQDEVDAYYELATPSREDSDSDSGQLAPCDILDWMEEKVGHDGITACSNHDRIRMTLKFTGGGMKVSNVQRRLAQVSNVYYLWNYMPSESEYIN